MVASTADTTATADAPPGRPADEHGPGAGSCVSAALSATPPTPPAHTKPAGHAMHDATTDGSPQPSAPALPFTNKYVPGAHGGTDKEHEVGNAPLDEPTPTVTFRMDPGPHDDGNAAHSHAPPDDRSHDATPLHEDGCPPLHSDSTTDSHDHAPADEHDGELPAAHDGGAPKHVCRHAHALDAPLVRHSGVRPVAHVGALAPPHVRGAGGGDTGRLHTGADAPPAQEQPAEHGAHSSAFDRYVPARHVVATGGGPGAGASDALYE